MFPAGARTITRPSRGRAPDRAQTAVGVRFAHCHRSQNCYRLRRLLALAAHLSRNPGAGYDSLDGFTEAAGVRP
jgi:hypothetical protein